VAGLRCPGGVIRTVAIPDSAITPARHHHPGRVRTLLPDPRRHRRQAARLQPGRGHRGCRVGQAPALPGRDTLPNGYCGRPPQQDCPHPNACLASDPGQADQTGSAGGCQKTGTRPTDRFPRQPEAASADSEVRPGPRLPTLRTHHLKIREAAPEALPTLSLPITGGETDSGIAVLKRADHPISYVLPARRVINGG
jgi:hypothetical protein